MRGLNEMLCLGVVHELMTALGTEGREIMAEGG